MDSFSENEPCTEIARYDDERVSRLVICQSDMRKDFKRLITSVANGITKVDVESLQYFTNAGTRQSALQILRSMEQKGEISFNNVDPLKQLLKDIDRHDLISQYIDTYKEKYGELATCGKNVQELSVPHTERAHSPTVQPDQTTAGRLLRYSAPVRRILPESHRTSAVVPGYTVTVPDIETPKPVFSRSDTFTYDGKDYSSLQPGAMLVQNSGNWTVSYGQNQRYLIYADPTKGGRVSPQRHSVCYGSNFSSAECILDEVETSHAHHHEDTRQMDLPPGSSNKPEIQSSVSSAVSGVSNATSSSLGDHDRKGHPKTEQSCLWSMKQSTLFHSLNHVGKVLSASKFYLPVGNSRWWYPSVTMKLHPKENTGSRHFSLEAQVVIPKSNSRRKWLVEYCQCFYILSVKVFNPNTNEVVGEEVKEVELAYSDIDHSHTTIIKLSKLLHHNTVLYGNEGTERFQFHANLQLVEYGYRMSDPQSMKFSLQSTNDGFVDIDFAKDE